MLYDCRKNIGRTLLQVAGPTCPLTSELRACMRTPNNSNALLPLCPLHPTNLYGRLRKTKGIRHKKQTQRAPTMVSLFSFFLYFSPYFLSLSPSISLSLYISARQELHLTTACTPTYPCKVSSVDLKVIPNSCFPIKGSSTKRPKTN